MVPHVLYHDLGIKTQAIDPIGCFIVSTLVNKMWTRFVGPMW